MLAILETLGLPPGEQRARARASCWRSWASWPWPASPPTRSRAASGGGWRSAAPWPPRPPSSCSTSPSRASTPWRSSTSRRSSPTCRDRGIGVLITDHNVRETLKITDRAYILREGEVFRSGTPSELASDEEVRRVYLGEAFRLGRAPGRDDPTRDLTSLAIQQKLGLRTRLSQRLILTPSLQQAIKLLPLTTLELAEVLEQEVMENPLLEEVPPGDRSPRRRWRQEERQGAGRATDPLKEIDVEKFFEDYLDDGEPPPHAQRRDPRAAAHREHAHRDARPLRPPHCGSSTCRSRTS